MKFKKNNFWIQLYYNYYWEYPKSLCGFFWKIVFASFMIITSPLQLLTLVKSKLNKNSNVFTEIHSNICIADKCMQLIGSYFSTVIVKDLNLLSSIYGYITMVILLTILMGILEICEELQNSYDSKYYNELAEKEPSIIWESVKTLKNKVCPIIELED